MSKEPPKVRERSAQPINAVSSIERARRMGAYREFESRRDKYREQIREAEERLTFAESNFDSYAAEKEIETLNFRLREMESNMRYLRMEMQG